MVGVNHLSLFLILVVAGSVSSTSTTTRTEVTPAHSWACFEAQCIADHPLQVKTASNEPDHSDTGAPAQTPHLEPTLVTLENVAQEQVPILLVVEPFELDDDGHGIGNVDEVQSDPQTPDEEYTTINSLDASEYNAPEFLEHASEESLFESSKTPANEVQSPLPPSHPSDACDSGCLSNDTASLFPCPKCDHIIEDQPVLHISSAYSAWADPAESGHEPVAANKWGESGIAIASSSEPRRANAVIFMLARNSDLSGVLSTVKQVEDRFNRRFQYPYVFLNDVPFEENFKSLVTQLTDAPVQFGLIPPEHWNQPLWINETRAFAAREEMAAHGIPYADSISYRNMCRFNSGFFYKHELLKPYRYYWRIEPDVKYFCDIDYDPFLFMQDNNKIYGFTMTLFEFPKTVETLWGAVREFMDANPEVIAADNAMDFVSDVGGLLFTYCHFWSNFEIGDFEFWRGDAYSKFFDYLDQQGGFYYERWGYAPIRSIAVSLFTKKDQIHFFNDIGYRHDPFQHCPQGDAHKKGKCWCDPAENFDRDSRSCLPQFEKLFKD